MKRLLVLILLLAVAASAQATTVGVWNNSSGTGFWSNASKWSGSNIPTTTAVAGDEIKIQSTGSAGADVTIDSTAQLNYLCRFTTGNAAGTVTIRVVDGANFGTGELRIGAKPSATVSGTSTLLQTGGTLSVTDLILGRGASTSATDSMIANGTYNISGGTLQYRTGDAGRLYVGAGSNTAAGSVVANLSGKFTVDGAAAIISMRKLYVGNDGASHYGTGTVEFKVGNSGVSKIQVADAGGILLDGGDGSGVANLALSFTGTTMPIGDIVLIENTNTGAVSGTFDQLNGVVGAATQGASVVLGGQTYTLSYTYDAVSHTDLVGNDIALVATPEPATMAILGFGAFLLRRRLA